MVIVYSFKVEGISLPCDTVALLMIVIYRPTLIRSIIVLVTHNFVMSMNY